MEDNNEDSDYINVIDEKIPANFNKLVGKLDEIKNKMLSQKKNLDDIGNDLKIFEKMIHKIIKKQVKTETKLKTKLELQPRKKCGFALPAQVTNDLCDFMEQPKGTFIARTDVTKFLMKYIEEQQLQNPMNRKNIIPDVKLMKLLGEEAIDKTITHFTIQKYINKHFIRSPGPSNKTSSFTNHFFEANPAVMNA